MFNAKHAFYRRFMVMSALLLSVSTLAQAVPNVTGKVTHQINSPSNPTSITAADPLTVSWTHTSSAYTAANMQLAYFMLYHVDNTGTGKILRPGKNTHYDLPSLDVGTHKFRVRSVQDYTDGTRKYSSYSSIVTVNVAPNFASNLFKAGEFTGSNNYKCMPTDMYTYWHKESRQIQSRINGHIVGVNSNIVNANNTLSGCNIADSDVVSTPFEISEAARQQIMAKPGNTMLYARTHACVAACSENRAEISYDLKKNRHSKFSDNGVHTQEGDIFWVTYRFNPVSLFEDGVRYTTEGSKPYFFLSQFHPETLTWGGNCQDPCTLVRHHSPSFSMIVMPKTDSAGYTDGDKAELRFRTKFWASSSAAKVSSFDMGQPKELDLKSWYQVKIGIKFSANHSTGWAIAALRKEGDTTWDYFSSGSNAGSIFKGKTLHAAPCSLGGEIGVGNYDGDCQAGQGHYETVFKSGVYYGNLDSSWSGQTDKHLEVLLDDYFATNNHHEEDTFEWPAHLSTSGDYIINDSTLNQLPFNSVNIPVTHKSF